MSEALAVVGGIVIVACNVILARKFARRWAYGVSAAAASWALGLGVIWIGASDVDYYLLVGIVGGTFLILVLEGVIKAGRAWQGSKRARRGVDV